VTSAVGQLIAASAELPAQRAEECRDGMVGSINWNLDAQSRFYTQRGAWITAAREICLFVDGRRDGIEFTADKLAFHDDDELAHFNRLVGIADEIHHLEVAQMAERLERLQGSLGALGFR